MEFRHMVSFLAIAEELHFGRAAAKLYLTQPSLSLQLQRLEKTLGVELVARTSHEVRLTAAGRAFEVQARAIVVQMDKAALIAREAAAGRSGTINVGYNFPVGQHVLPTTLARMNVRYPNVSVIPTEKRSGPQLAALSSGELDVALMYGHPVTPEFGWHRLLGVQLVAVVGQDHRWAGRSGVPFAEIAQHPCMMFDRKQSPAMYDAILNSARRCGITLNVVYQLDDPGATAIVVCSRPLVGFASMSRARAVSSAVSSLRAVLVELYDPVPVIDVYAVWRAGDDNPLVGIFLDCIKAAAPFEAPSTVRAMTKVAD